METTFQALQLLRRWDEAGENYRKILSFDPQNAVAREQLRTCKHPPKQKKKKVKKQDFGEIYEKFVAQKKKAPKRADPAEKIVWTDVKQ